MATASRVSVNTKLKIGWATTGIGLMKAIGDPPGKQTWEKKERPDPAAEQRQEAIETAKKLLQPSEEAKADPLGGGKLTEAPPRSPEEEAAEEKVLDSLVKLNAEALAAAKPMKGVLKDDGEFVDLTDQIEEIGERSKLEQAEIVTFLDRSHVPRERIISSYYVAAGNVDPDAGELPADKFLRNLQVSLHRSKKVAVVRFSKKKGQTVGILTVTRVGALLLHELCFAEQWKAPGAKALTFTHLDASEKAVEPTMELIEAMAGRREDLDDIHDLRAQMEAELAEKAKAGEMDEYTLDQPDPAQDPDIERLGEMMREAALN
jgi:non-homologous end joining protein Ku